MTHRDLISIEKCARCGYCEIKSALHVHHIDGDHSNDDPDNLVVLCANCHFGLHHGVWFLSDIGIEVPESKNTAIVISELKLENRRLKQQLVITTKPTIYTDNTKRIMAFLCHYAGREHDFIEFFFNLPTYLFDCVDGDYGKHTQILVSSIISIYEELGYRNWKWLHPESVVRIIEGRMCSLSISKGDRTNWVADAHLQCFEVT